MLIDAIFFFIRHNSQLVCMVGIAYVYIDAIFAFNGYVDFFLLMLLYCLVGCLSVIVWTHAVLGCLVCMCFILFALVQRN